MQNSPQIYVLLFSLYWAQGLPVGFMTHALPVILRAEGISLAHIGGFGLLMIPWSFKIFWAPLVDRYGSTRYGHYRTWIIPTQILSIIILVLLAYMPIDYLNNSLYLLIFFILLLNLNFVGATQDIATDGLAVKTLQKNQQQWGNTFQVIGSRLGFIVGGGALLWALDWLDWQNTFLLLALCVALNTLPILLFRRESIQQEYQATKTRTLSLTGIVRELFNRFIHVPILRSWLIVLITFKIADGLSGPIIKPLMVDMGLNFKQIGIYITMFGAFSALIGAGLAAVILKWCSRANALIIFSVLKVFTWFAYAWLAHQYESLGVVKTWQIYILNAFEELLSAMLLVFMLTLIMQYSQAKQGATDFTFQVAIMATVSGLLYIISGLFAEYFGYTGYLILISLVALLMLLPIWYWIKLNHQSLQSINQ